MSYSGRGVSDVYYDDGAGVPEISVYTYEGDKSKHYSFRMNPSTLNWTVTVAYDVYCVNLKGPRST